jgi:hypothetical protein
LWLRDLRKALRWRCNIGTLIGSKWRPPTLIGNV